MIAEGLISSDEGETTTRNFNLMAAKRGWWTKEEMDAMAVDIQLSRKDRWQGIMVKGGVRRSLEHGDETPDETVRWWVEETAKIKVVGTKVW
jgi:hypothetical protein